MPTFTYIDKDGSGYITVDKLQKPQVEQNMEDAFLEDIILEVNQNNVSLPSDSLLSCMRLVVFKKFMK